MKLKETARKLKSDIPAVFVAMADKRTPWYAKTLAAVTICYALSPIDLIPDFVPLLGYLDDLIILPLLVAATVKLVPDNVFREARIKSAGIWKNGKPKKWYFAVPIVLIWVVILWLIVRNFI